MATGPGEKRGKVGFRQHNKKENAKFTKYSVLVSFVTSLTVYNLTLVCFSPAVSPPRTPLPAALEDTTGEKKIFHLIALGELQSIFANRKCQHTPNNICACFGACFPLVCYTRVVVISRISRCAHTYSPTRIVTLHAPIVVVHL